VQHLHENNNKKTRSVGDAVTVRVGVELSA